MPFKGGVAVCMTGRSSTLMSKPVRGSFVTNALAPLKANGTAVDLFLVLSGVPTASRDALGVLVKRAYPVSNMGFLDAVTEEPKCPFDARSKDTKMGPKSFSAAKRPSYREYQRTTRVFWPFELPLVDHGRRDFWPRPGARVRFAPS